MARQPVAINGLEFDALIGEDKTLSADVPSYSVESGYEVSDNISIKPKEITLTLYVTNTPVTWQQRHGTYPGRVAEVVYELERIFWSRELVTVTTATDIYSNMAITQLKVPKDTTNYSSREIQVSLKEVNTVSAALTSIPSYYGRGGKTKENSGTANVSGGSSGGSSGASSGSGTQEKEESKEAGSILYGLLKGGRS